MEQRFELTKEEALFIIDALGDAVSYYQWREEYGYESPGYYIEEVLKCVEIANRIKEWKDEMD